MFQAPDRTRIAVWLRSLQGPGRRLDLGAIDPASPFSLSATGAVAFAGRTPSSPPELYYMASPDSAPRRLTDYNAELAGRRTGRVETLVWDGPDGFEGNGVVILPPGFAPGRRYPLVLNIHGRPMGTSTEGWSGFDQLLAAQGWIVFQPNYRGSTNQGDAFQRAVVNDAGGGPGRDVMAGIDALKARGIVDESRIAVSGWSYGGFMTAWLTAHYQAGAPRWPARP